MNIHEFGEENTDVIVLFHPLGVRWDVFNYVIPILRKSYHIIIPAIPGFDPDAPDTDFTSIEQIADEMDIWLVSQGFGSIKCLYGCSMGGGIVARMLAVQKVNVDCAVMDGGMTPYQCWKPLTYLIGIRDFVMMEAGKHMSIKALQSLFDSEKYTEDDLKYVKEVMSSLSAKTIWRSFYSCNNYSMPKSISLSNCNIAYWYGSDEKKSRKWDIAYVSKEFPNVKIIENAGMGHAEFFILYPEKFCEKLMEWIRLLER